MFKKLISNLAYNPSLMGEIAAYEQRMKKQLRLRFAGLALAIIGVVLQLLFFSYYSSPARPAVVYAAQSGQLQTAPTEALSAHTKDALYVSDALLLFLAGSLYLRNKLLLKELQMVRAWHTKTENF